MKRIGITGGIATGKSSVSRYLIDLGYPVIDADQIARKVVEPDSLGLTRLVDLFGPAILLADGSLDRHGLGQRLFADQQVQRQVNDILHPIIFREIELMFDAYQKDKQSLVFADIPLLYESNYQVKLDQVWLVYIHPALQLQRLMARNQLDEQAAKQRIASQMPMQHKIKLADVIINNGGSLSQTYQQVDRLLAKLV